MSDKKSYKFDVHLRFRDQDVLGHVNNATYFTFFEDARAAFLRSHQIAFEDPDIFFLIGHIGCSFKKPVIYDMQDPRIAIHIRCNEIGSKSFKIGYTVTDPEDESNVYAVGESVQVCFDPKAGKTIPVSQKLKDLLSPYLV